MYSGVDERFLSSVMPAPQGLPWNWEDIALWWGLACAKVSVGPSLFFCFRFVMVFIMSLAGILAIFVWRILAKSLLHLTLPPLFRLLASCFDLPHRRFYTPATDYQHMPVESSLRPIPSVIDLPGVLEVSGIREKSVTSEVKRRGAKSNNGALSVNGDLSNYTGSELESSSGPSRHKDVKHYDADGEYTAHLL